MKQRFSVFVSFFILAFYFIGAYSDAKTLSPRKLPIIKQVQITSEIEPVLYMAVSADAKYLVYTSGREGFTDLWQKSADPNVVLLPKRLTNDPSSEFSPTFSPDSRFIAFVGTNYDVKGDIFLFDIKSERTERLTDRSTEDGGPCFSPDGKKLYFHQARSGDSDRYIVSVSLDDMKRIPSKLSLGGDAAWPSLSPDGQKMAFVSYRNDRAGDLFLIDLNSNRIRQITSGTMTDFYPSWSYDSKSVFFSRFVQDTDNDGKITSKDNAAIYSLNIEKINAPAFPITSAEKSSFYPIQIKDRLFFLSNQGGVNNVWLLPSTGPIQELPTATEQLAQAKEVEKIIPFNPYITLIAYYKVLELFPEDRYCGTHSLYEIGKIYQSLQMPELAKQSYELITCKGTDCPFDYSSVSPIAQFAEIGRISIETQTKIENTTVRSSQHDILKNGVSQLAKITNEASVLVKSKSYIEQARLLYLFARDSKSILEAIQLLDKISKYKVEKEDKDNYNLYREQLAQALVLKGDLFALMSKSDSMTSIYSDVIKNFNDVRLWADTAVDRVISITLDSFKQLSLSEQVSAFRKMAKKNQSETPSLAMGALNKAGDLLYASNEQERAKDAYKETLTEFPVLTTQTTAARLSLAEILYKEERFRQALDLYETELAERPYEDSLYHLARAGYIRKSVDSGEALYRMGEIFSARKTFLSLIDYDDNIVEAHRGYIKCAAAIKQLDPVLAGYQSRLAQHKDDPIALYATALCLTYYENAKSLENARKLLTQAIAGNAQIEYFHQTLGYVLEVLETVYKKSGMLEIALESYKKAHFLNDSKSNPLNAANLCLNLGNAYLLLNQFENALRYYTLRESFKIPFDNINTEILFYQRKGISAFQAGANAESIAAFGKALSMIEAETNPQGATKAFDNLSGFIMDNVVIPCSKQENIAAQSKTLAAAQAEINHKLARLNQNPIFAPPSQDWEPYRKNIESLISEQEYINKQAYKLSKRIDNPQFESEKIHDSIAIKTINIKEALKFPTRLAQMKAETHDRLGLAFQENRNWENAIKHFEETYKINQGLELSQNLALNRRSIAFNRYMMAADYSGDAREKLLRTSSNDFQDAINAVNKYGVASKKKKSSWWNLLNLSFDVSTDSSNVTSAAYGFSSEQEKNLAEAFISRIKIELGETDTAKIAMDKQLEKYPKSSIIKDNDIYGVALLFHRAGQLEAGRNNLIGAFDWFKRSAELCLKIQNPVSTCINICNMANILAGMSEDSIYAAQYPIYRSELKQFDIQAQKLLSIKPDIGGQPIRSMYHNIMGVRSLKIFKHPFILSGKKLGLTSWNVQDSSEIIRPEISDMLAIQEAMVHFQLALKFLEARKDKPERQDLALLGSVHLNIGRLSLALGETENAQKYFQLAFFVSEKAMLPDIRWRALVGLKRFEDAINVLNSMTVVRAGCQKQEIIEAFSPMIQNLIIEGQTEQGFNLAEQVSDLQRYQILAPMFGSFSEKEQTLLKLAYPHVEQLVEIRSELEKSDETKRIYVKDRLNQELAILDEVLGKDMSNLPKKLRSISEIETRYLVIRLLGIAIEAENVADESIKTGNPQKAETLKGNYYQLIKRYVQIREQARQAKDNITDTITFFGAEPVEAIDVMSNLPPNSKFYRIVKIDSGYTIFELTPDEIKAKSVESLGEANIENKGTVYVAYEKPEILANMNINLIALSGTHYVRSVTNKKPFKRSVLFVNMQNKPLLPEFSGNRFYDVTVVDSKSINEANAALNQDITSSFPFSSNRIHTIVVADPIGEFHTVPTREGEIPDKFLGLRLDKGYIENFEKLLNKSVNLSLSVFSNADIKDSFVIGHLFSLYGCSQVMMPLKKVNDLGSLNKFFEYYKEMSTVSALEKINRDSNENWILLGYQGMTPEESQTFARDNFINYVQQAKAAYERQKFGKSQAMFENAINVAQETEEYQKYLPELYLGACSAAFGELNFEAALIHGKAYLKRMDEQNADKNTKTYAEALLRLGVIHSKLEQYAQAIPLLQQAVQIISDLNLGPEQVDALTNLGLVLENATEYDRALVHFQTAVTISKSLHKNDLLARQYANIGRINDLRLSQYAQAILQYKSALDLYESGGKSDQVVRLMIDIGRCYRLLGSLSESAKWYEKAMSIVTDQAAKDKNMFEQLKSEIFIEQANLAWFVGKYNDAFKLQRNCYNMAVANEWPLIKTVAMNTSGLLFWTLGDNMKALDDLQKALDTAKTLQNREDEYATTLHNMGVVYREMGQYQKALDAFDKAIEIDTKLKSRWAIAYDLRNKALTFLRMNQPDKAIPMLIRSVEEAAAIGNKINEAKGLLGLGDAYLATVNGTEAEKSYQKSLTLSRSMSIRETEWRALYGLARIRIFEGHPNDAVKLLQSSIEVIENMRSDIRIEQLKDSFVGNKLSVYETLVSVLTDMGEIKQAFDVAERSRARNFIDILGNQRLSLNGAIDQKLYDRQTAIKSEIYEHEALIAQARDTKERTLYEKGLEKLQKDLKDVMLDIQASNPQLASMVAIDPLSCDSVQKKLDQGVTLLTYYVLQDEILCFVVKSNKIELIRTPLGKGTLEQTIMEYRRMIQNLEPLEEYSIRLYDWLIKPVISKLGDSKTVGIIPHSGLHYLSFGTLSDGKSYLAENYPIFYLPSASVFNYTLQKRPKMKNVEVLAIGNPDLGNEALELPFSEYEVSSIRWNFPKITVLERGKATETWVKSNISRFGIIHMASHGEFDPINPLFSAIHLAKEEKSDGKLHAEEVFGLKINADMVVLSACQTGLGKIFEGDEVIGLNRSFFFAGTHTIISSLWRVSDISTAILIKQFYRELSTHNKAESLRLAIQHVKKQYGHPGYWGAFTLVGDYY